MKKLTVYELSRPVKDFLKSFSLLAIEITFNIQNLSVQDQLEFIQTFSSLIDVPIIFNTKDDPNHDQFQVRQGIIFSIFFSCLVFEFYLKYHLKDSGLTEQKYFHYRESVLQKKNGRIIEKISSKIEQLLDKIINGIQELHSTNILTGFSFEEYMISWYEFYLSIVEKKTKHKRGVFYTPRPVIKFIFNSLSDVLEKEFQTSFSDLKLSEFSILDPAMGSGSFIFYFLDWMAKNTSLPVDNRDILPPKSKKILSDLLSSFYGVELLPESYLIFQILLKLKLGKFSENLINNSFFQGNTLVQSTLGLFHSQVKPNLIVGNPPYSGHSQTRDFWVDSLLKSLSSYYEINGKILREKTSKWLQDDYVKFFRLAHHLIEEKGYGVLAFITNHGFLENPTFRGMRYQLFNFFSDIYILNLHGYYLDKRRENHDLDQNIFNIKKGVCISIFVKNKAERGCDRVHYFEIFGLKENKLRFLDDQSLKTVPWSIVYPKGENYYFIPIDVKKEEEYLKGWKLISQNPKEKTVFKKSTVGLLTSQDAVVIQLQRNNLVNLLTDFSSKSLSELQKKYYTKDNSCWRLEKAVNDVKQTGEFEKRIQKIQYRPFDFRYTYFTGHSSGFLCRPRRLMQVMIDVKNNLGLVVARTNKTHVMDHFLISRYITEAKTAESSTQSYLIPFYLAKDESNFSADFIRFIVDTTKLTLIDAQHGDFISTISYLDILGYIYAVLYSNKYRTYFKEFLGKDFPRIYFSTNKTLFKELSHLGMQLLSFHLMKFDISPEEPHFGLHLPDNAIPKKLQLKWEGKKLYLGSEHYISNLDYHIYDFKIGGYSVLKNWIMARRGETIDKQDLQRLIHTIERTLTNMERIDKRIIDLFELWIN